MNQNNDNNEIDLSNRVKFEGEESFRVNQSFQTSTPKILQQVIKHSGGVIKNEKQAYYFLIGFVIVAIIISIILFRKDGSKAKFVAPAGFEIIYDKNIPPHLQKI